MSEHIETGIERHWREEEEAEKAERLRNLAYMAAHVCPIGSYARPDCGNQIHGHSSLWGSLFGGIFG